MHLDQSLNDQDICDYHEFCPLRCIHYLNDVFVCQLRISPVVELQTSPKSPRVLVPDPWKTSPLLVPNRLVGGETCVLAAARIITVCS